MNSLAHLRQSCLSFVNPRGVLTFFLLQRDEGVAGRSLAAVDDVTCLRHVLVSAHFVAALSAGTARFAKRC